MKCKEAQLLISNYLDGILPIEKEQNFLRHVKSCTKCSRELESTKSLLEMFSLIKPVEKDTSFYREIMTGFYRKRGEDRKGSSVFDRLAGWIEPYMKPVLIGLGCAVIILCAVVFTDLTQREAEFTMQEPEDEIEYLLEEYAILKDRQAFSRGTYAVLVSSSYYSETENSKRNEKR